MRSNLGPIRRRLAEESGIAGLVLVIVIAWALAAVLMLTGTLINAREIDDQVKVINTQVTPIDKDLNNVALLKRTTQLTIRIRKAAKPLSGQLDQVIGAARQIDRSAKSILNTAGDINQTAKTIHGTVFDINDTARSINAVVTSIHGNVSSINGSVNSIHGRVVAINSTVAAGPNSINGLVRTIQGSIRRILTTAHTIDNGGSTGGVAGINRRADAGISTVAGIRTDLANVLTQVGRTGAGGHGSGGNATIHGHANSIDCSRVINLLGPTAFCGR
jgi:methyl-accepting chemotaxis protein